MISGIYPEEKKLVLDNYTISQFRACPRKLYHRTIERLIPGATDMWSQEEVVEPPIPDYLLWGIAHHKGQDQLWMSGNLQEAQNAFEEAFDPIPESSHYTVERGRNLIEAYANRWSFELNNLDTVQCEIKFQTNLGTIEHFPAKSDNFGRHVAEKWTLDVGGVIDKLYTRTDNTDHFYLCDHKTSSWESESLLPTQKLSNQFGGYVYGTQQILKKLDSNASCESLEADILYLNARSSTPKFYRVEVNFNEEKLNEWKAGILQTGRMILDCFYNEVWPMYGKEPCAAWNKTCEFFDICDASIAYRDTVKTANYIESAWDIDKR